MNGGRFHGIGLGVDGTSGLTDEARSGLRQARVVYCPRSSRSTRSRAASRVKELGERRGEIREFRLDMHGSDGKLEEQYNRCAERITRRVRRGESVAAATLGGPGFYSTLAALLEQLRSRLEEKQIRVVPGITSFQAAGSLLNRPLVRGEESLAVVTGSQPPEALDRALRYFETVVVMKIHRHFPRLRRTIEDLGRLEDSHLMSRIGTPEATRRPLDEVDPGTTPPYFSLLLSLNGASSS